MSKNSVIIVFLSFLLFIPLLVRSQSTISDTEKKELENRFKALKTYYIRDDGTVAFYTTKTSDATENSNSESQDAASNPSSVGIEVKPAPKTPASKKDQGRVKVKVSVDASGDYVVSKEEPEIVLTHPSIIKDEEPEEIVVETPIIFEAVKVEEPKTVHPEPESPKPVTAKAEVQTTKSEPKSASKSTTVSSKAAAVESTTSGSKKTRDVFKRKESSYKTLEEAAMAVDDLLEQLKKERENEKNATRRNSLSNRMSGGIDGSLRQNSDNGYYVEKKSDNVDDNILTSTEPTYYINGIRATAEAYKLLETKDILRKERRVSDANPHGEWWIETRQR